MPDHKPRDPLKLDHAQEVLGYFEQIEGQFAQVREGLTHLQRLATLGTLSAMVAHEFNNILTPVISYTQMALANPDDRDLSRKALEKALSGAERAAHISTSLMGFSREEDTRSRAHLKQAVNSALSCLARDPGRDGVELRLDLADVEVAMSPINLEQVLLNLILNAQKAMAPKGGVLTIHGWAEADKAHIDLSDTGGGVPSEIADRLFEPFVTHDSTPDAGGARGSGLGLSVCRDLIVNAGGEVGFDSEPGEGTTFHLVIPLAKPLRKSA